MDAQSEALLRKLVGERLAKQAPEIQRSLRQIAAGNPLGAEPVAERSARRMAAKAGLTEHDAVALTAMVRQTAAVIDERREATGAEALQGPTMDLVGVDFLTKGRLVANAVGRVVFKSGRAQGSGFLVAPDLFITNHHVIPSREAAVQMVVEFDYETDGDAARPITTFAFDAAACYVFDPIDQLDFTLIAIGPRLSGAKALTSFGYVVLSDAADKHMLGEIANIIQHPQGGYKQLVVRENNLISRDETDQVLHYLADTEKGSSGSPVCNNAWEPIALHHWGEPHLELKNALGQPLRGDVNEGIRISAIVKALKDRSASMRDPDRTRLLRMLQAWGASPRSGPVLPVADASDTRTESSSTVGGPSPASTLGPRIASDGTATWVLPVELSVRLPLSYGAVAAPSLSTYAVALPAAPSRAEKSASSEDDFSDRGGYEPGFISGVLVPLPDYSGVPYRIADNQLARRGEDPHELAYHHFSIVMNADRRLALFTACNIDGRRLVAVNRRDKTTNADPTLNDLGVESLGAESSDDFRADPRILAGEQMAIEFYEDQKVPGFAKPVFPGNDASPEERRAYARAMNERTARMFQKGHITLRGDPAWGTADQALLAENDTFYYTNAAPQLGFFNQGSPKTSPGAKGKLRWRAVETYVLRNAFTMRRRVSVFAGPIFDDEHDVDYRFGSQVPMRFWKLVVWKGQGGLQSVALLADQRPVLERLTRGVPEGMEAFGDEEELARVTEFLTTVKHLEELTNLRFSRDVHEGDIRSGIAGPESAWDFGLRD